MGVRMTGQVTTASYAKRDPRVCSSGPIILQPSRIDDSTHPSLGQFRVDGRRFTHRQSTILSYLKGWIAEIWHNIIRRVRHMFSQQADPCCPEKIPSRMDSALENACWREGIRKMGQTRGSLSRKASSGYGDYKDIYYLYKAKPGLQCLSTDESELETSKKSEYNSAGFKKRRYLPGRIDSPLSFNDESNALYEIKAVQLTGGAFGEGIRTGGCLGRPGQKLPDSETKPESPMDRPQDTMDGEWIRTVCFRSVWNSKSELHTSVPDRQATVNRKRHTSRIPRLCSRSKRPLPEN